ncbi:MAG: cell division protein FtsL [Candidatus Aminicenantes bacterium]|nr:cell division protein FtsL [Candidatus Aminicenantes bacterium]
MVRRKLNRKEIALWVLASLMTIVTLTFYLWHITENVRLGYDIGRGEVRKQELRDEIKRLETHKAAFSSLERVERIAREELGMTETREDQIIYKDR